MDDKRVYDLLNKVYSVLNFVTPEGQGLEQEVMEALEVAKKAIKNRIDRTSDLQSLVTEFERYDTVKTKIEASVKVIEDGRRIMYRVHASKEWRDDPGLWYDMDRWIKSQADEYIRRTKPIEMSKKQEQLVLAALKEKRTENDMLKQRIGNMVKSMTLENGE